MSIMIKPLSLTVNGKSVGPIDVPETIPMLNFLHEYLNLTGTRLGCGQGICRACAVIVDGAGGTSQEMRTCINSAHSFAGKSVRTVEAHAKRDADGNVVELSPIQQAFVEHFSFQCGYCTPGFVNSATVLLERLQRNPVARKDVEAAIDDTLGQHICRCTGYVRYFAAMRDVILSKPSLLRD